MIVKRTGRLFKKKTSAMAAYPSGRLIGRGGLIKVCEIIGTVAY